MQKDKDAKLILNVLNLQFTENCFLLNPLNIFPQNTLSGDYEAKAVNQILLKHIP
jgi:hypothetical protein